MTDIYVSVARLRRDADRGSSGALVNLLARAIVYGDAEHRMVWSLFGDKAVVSGGKRPFVYRADLEGRETVFSILSSIPPAPTENIWELQTKKLKAPIAKGMPFGYRLRANPAVNEGGEKGRRDVVRIARDKGDDRPVADIAREDGSAWLRAKAERHGFGIQDEGLRAFNYRVRRFSKMGERAGASITLPQMEFEGTGWVTDPDLFIATLTGGIGPGKAYGCGALFIRPAEF